MSFSITFNNQKYNFRISQPEWLSNNIPTMCQSTSCEIIKDKNINEKLETIDLPNEIKSFYKEIGSSIQEIYINEWTLFSIENIIKMTDYYKKNNINTIDIAFKYLGMGNVKVAFYDTNLKTILYRNDGGSNGYDRQNNFNKLKNFNNLSNYDKSNRINFDTFLSEIIEKNIETSVIF